MHFSFDDNIKKGELDNVVEILNGFHENIKFTFEKEVDDCISFLDVKVIKNSDWSFETDIHRKKTAPKPWKIGTLKGLIRRAFTVCSTEEYREKEVAFLKRMNEFPSKVVNKFVYEVRSKMMNGNIPLVVSDTVPETQNPTVVPVAPFVPDPPSNEEIYTPYICLPYKGLPGEEIIRKFRSILTKVMYNLE